MKRSQNRQDMLVIGLLGGSIFLSSAFGFWANFLFSGGAPDGSRGDAPAENR